MKLYEFHPKSKGWVFHTVAETEKEARAKVEAHIKNYHTTPTGELAPTVIGWGTDYYFCISHALEEVSESPNDGQ